ncbi:MAG TPA: TonB-dependent receptor [bacterium]|nr:TonB-dependent receptor [bacterium]HPG44593.1 TonB-dependent receptor [bacterium]HPM97151.1 TonB-dependent receptor [bacterium]
MKPWFSTSLVLAILCCTALAAGAGKTLIRGRVTDKETGEPLPGVNVIVSGTYKGAATDENGEFTISGLAPGDYDLRASMIGYTVQVQTGIKISPISPTTVTFALESTVLALGQTVQVIGEKPLFETDITASQQRISSEEISQKVVENLNDLVADQLGVVMQDNKIHIRGGRADESMYVIDGQSVKDPLSGYSNTLYVNASAIKELKVITGGFNAEYGQAMSGIVDIETKEGEEEFSGSVIYKTDNAFSGFIDGFNTDIAQVNLGGPEPISTNLLRGIGIRLPGQVSFFFSGYTHLSDSYLPGADKLYPSKSEYEKFARRQENDWHLLGKLTWNLRPGQKLSYSYDRSVNINQGYFIANISGNRGYPYEYEKMLDNYNTFTKEALLNTLQWVHTLNPRTYYRLSLSRFYTGIHSAVQNKEWTEYEERLDLEPVYYIPDSQGNIQTRFGDGFWDTGDAENWYDYYSDNFSLKGDLTAQPNERHSIKTGFESRYTEMQVIDINAPWFGETGLGRNYDYFRVYPNDGSFYIQDRITYSGMIVNIGLRYDYWFPGKYVDDAIADPETITITDAARQKYRAETFSLLGMRGKGHLSPRLGISHPVTDNDMLYLYYGHFSQRPNGQYVYAKLKSTSEATYQLFGNPNLNPTTTVAYEIGLKHRFNANQTIEIKAYYKDMFDYPTSASVRKYSPRYGNISFLMYVNMDYARARGIEVRFRRRYSKYLSGNVDFTYALATGKSSTPNTNLLVAAGKVAEKTLGESRLAWDKPYRLSADLYFDMPRNADLRLWGLRLPENWGVTLRWEFESGKRFQKLIDVANHIYEKDEYGSLSDPWMRTDIKFYKDFSLADRKMSFFVEAENVFNTKVPRIINPVTGRPYEPGDVIPLTWYDDPMDLPADNPARYDWPRRVMTGVGIHF